MEPKWEALRQRIVLSYHLSHLSAADTPAYIAHRLRVAASDGGCIAEFTTEAVADIHAATDGIPRLINILCDNALLVGYAKSLQTIDRPVVAEVLQGMTCWGLRTSPEVSVMPSGR
jgi:general secretion pathway protein A